MTTKHAPGPWRYEKADGFCGEIIAANGYCIAVFVDEPSDQDAMLLTAAPELLLALRTIARKTWHRGTAMLHEEEMILVTQAIARATGEQP